MLAALSGHAEIVSVLLDRGADANMRDNVKGLTPFELAREASRGADPAVMKMIEDGDLNFDASAAEVKRPNGLEL